MPDRKAVPRIELVAPEAKLMTGNAIAMSADMTVPPARAVGSLTAPRRIGPPAPGFSPTRRFGFGCYEGEFMALEHATGSATVRSNDPQPR
jgi:hypothetical protein